MNDNVLYPFPRTLNITQWEMYLGRKVADDERSLIESVKDERQNNNDLQDLFDIVTKKGLYIPRLTSRNGNCLFESLTILGLCEDQDNFRKFLAHLMYVFRNKKNFFGNQDSRSLEEMFNDTNEVKYVLCNEDYRIYKYTFATMCVDFASGFSWTRLPTQLIIQFISLLMNVRFEIYSNTSEFVNVLDANTIENNNDISVKRIICLGHLGEKHYVPLKAKQYSNSENVCPKYGDSKKFFFEWAIAMERSLNGIQENNLQNNSENNSDNGTHERTYDNSNKTDDYTEIINPLNESENNNNRVEYTQ